MDPWGEIMVYGLLSAILNSGCKYLLQFLASVLRFMVSLLFFYCVRQSLAGALKRYTSPSWPHSFVTFYCVFFFFLFGFGIKVLFTSWDISHVLSLPILWSSLRSTGVISSFLKDLVAFSSDFFRILVFGRLLLLQSRCSLWV